MLLVQRFPVPKSYVPRAMAPPPQCPFPSRRFTVWLDDDHSDDERPLASLTWISSPEFSSPSSVKRPSDVATEVPSDDDEIQLVKVIPAVVDLLTPPKPKPRPPASPLYSVPVVSVVPPTGPAASQGLRKAVAVRNTPVKAEVVTPKRSARLRVKTELFTPKRVLRVRRHVGGTPGERHSLHPLTPNRTCVRGFVQARACHLKQREKLAALFGDFGWPGPGDGASRRAIAELLGLKAAPKAVTHLAWAARRDHRQAEHLLAAAILSVYRFRGKRRCGCLEFIVSRSRGFGSRLLHLAQRFMKGQNISRLFSGVDLSRPYAMAAHNSWGFRKVTQQDWAEAGLATYSQGDVCYMVLDLDSDMDAAPNLSVD